MPTPTEPHTWYDSPDPANRTLAIEWWPWIQSDAGNASVQGDLYSYARKHPSDVWPPPSRISGRVALADAAVFALAHGCPYLG